MILILHAQLVSSGLIRLNAGVSLFYLFKTLEDAIVQFHALSMPKAASAIYE